MEKSTKAEIEQPYTKNRAKQNRQNTKAKQTPDKKTTGKTMIG